MADGILLRELYLVRHGESRGNAGIDPGDSLMEREDPALTEKGVSQAEKLGKFLRDTEFACIYSSGLRRAAATAAEIAKRQAGKDILILPELCEISVNPEYPGKSLEELRGENPEVNLAPAPGREGMSFVIPDDTPGENEERYFERAGKALDYIFARHTSGEKVLITGHAGFLTYIIFYLTGLRDREPFYDFCLSNTGVTKIDFYEPGTNKYGDMVFDYVNRTGHLL